MNFSSQREEDLFHRALALPEAERAGFLGREAADNPELRASVESLLKHHDDARRFLHSAAPGVADAIAQLVSGPVEKPGDMIGRYKLLQKIGEGGCGIVYMAEQQEPVIRRVALKVIKVGMDTREVIARFEAERQALALMDHPNIARVLDGGATESGRPYFVMELVRGVPITTYCDEQNLSTPARLELFTLVCHAIQHAHQKGIIHRDLKPSNILVTLHDGCPVPKVIDFGIAKATQGKLTNATLFTAFEQFIGTPAYMSPEQAELSGLDIDTRSDIYSLGVLLYELLTGRPPFDPKSLLAAGLDEIRRIIREVDPPRPSTRLSTLTDADRSTIAKHRSTAPAHLSVILRGDLDWIVMHCLEKNRTRRYDTPSALAADIARHLTHEPVQARPPSAAYRLAKMIRRNRLFCTAAAATVTALVLGLGVSTWQWFEKTQAFHRAREAERAQAALRERAEAAGMREAEQRILAEGNAAKAARQEAYARRLLYASDMNLAQQALRANDVGRARQLLERHQPKPGETDLRGWEWRYLWQQSRNSALATLTRHTDRVNWLSFSRDSRWLAIGHWDGRTEVWDVPARTLRTTLRTSGAYGAVCFSPTENLLAFAAGVGRIVVHDLDTATNKFLLAPHGGAAERFSFSPDGARLACVSDYGVQVFSLIDGSLVFRRLDGFRGSAHFGAVRFSPDGTTLFVNRQQNGNELTVVALDARDGKLKREFAVGRDAGQTSLALSPDGRVLATASGFGDETVRIWNPDTGAALAELKNHTAWVGEVAFSPDGKFLASAAADQTIRLWDTTAWSEAAVLRGHGNEVHAIAFSPDGRLIASGDKNGEVLLWSTDRFTTVQSRFSFPSDIVQAWIPPDTNDVLTLSKSGSVSRWDLATLKETPVNLPGPMDFFWRPRYFGLRAPNQAIRVYEVLPADARLIGEAVVGERARRIEFGGARLTWYDASGRNQEKELRPRSASHFPNIFPLSVRMEGGRVVLRQHADPREVVAVHELPGERESVVYSHDHTRVAVSTDHGVVALFDRSGKQLLRLRAHMKSVCTAVFSPDDRRLITIGSTRELAKVWDIETGQELLTLAGEGSNSYEATMSSDGNALLAGTDGEGHWQLWQAPGWAEIDGTAWLATEGSARVHQKPAVAPIRDPDNGIYLVRRDPVSGAFNGPATPLTPHFPESNFGPAWSPDGKQIAFKRTRPTVPDRPERFFDLVVQPVGLTQERVYRAIESEPGPWIAPVWCPDMQSVIVRNFVDMTVRKNHRINLADESVHVLPVAPEKSAVTISHDGRTLYSTINDRKEKTVSLLAVDAATGSTTKLWTSPFPMHEHRPPLRLALSPDGRTLAMVLAGPGDDSHLVRVGTDGSNHRVLVTAKGISRSGLCWAENGRALLYCTGAAVDQPLMRISADGGMPRFTGLTLRGDADVIFDLSPDGEQLAVAPGMPIFTNPEAFNNEVMWEWMLAQELARNFEPAESVARELLARYQQQNGTPLGHAGTRTVLGRILVRREKFAEAEEVLRPAYQARNDRAPDDWLTHITRSVLGGALVGAGKLAEAEPLLREAYRGLTASFDLSREDEPRPTEAAEWLAGLEEKRGHTDRAAQWRQRGRGFNFAVRAQRLLDDKEYVRAAEGFEEATRLDPALESVWNALGWLRATASDPTARNGRAAVAAALKACELTAYKNAAYIDTLAAAYAESGDFDRAVEHQQNALQQGKLSDRERAGYEARLALYRERRPFHQPSR